MAPAAKVTVAATRSGVQAPAVTTVTAVAQAVPQNYTTKSLSQFGTSEKTPVRSRILYSREISTEERYRIAVSEVCSGKLFAIAHFFR